MANDFLLFRPARLPVIFLCCFCFVAGYAVTANAQQPSFPIDPDYFRYRKLADNCFAKRDYTGAKLNYRIAGTIKPNDEYCQKGIAICDKPPVKAKAKGRRKSNFLRDLESIFN